MLFDLDAARRRRQAEDLHDQAMGLESEGKLAEAEALYLKALELDANRPMTLFNLGLICKWQRRWEESLRYNQRALQLDPKNEGACWNLGIAATALARWEIARTAWREFGVPIPEGTGPIRMDLGPTPIRIDPEGEHPEVLWTDRIDPARAVITSVPFPESGLAWGDMVLHDGQPVGWRRLGQQEVPVFDVLELLERSRLSTFVAEVEADSTEAVAELTELFEAHELQAENWTTGVRWLCKACSEGRPGDHPAHDHRAVAPGSTFRIGIAAVAAHEVERLLHQWAERPGREVLSLTCGLAR